MTELEIAQRDALAGCRFAPGTTEKRFVRHLAEQDPTYELSAKQRYFLDKLAHRYRKQIGQCLSAACTECKPTTPKMLRPRLHLRSDLVDGKRVIEARNQPRAPTYAEAIDALERAESAAAKQNAAQPAMTLRIWGVRWWFNRNSNQRAIVRCECGEAVVTIDSVYSVDEVCRTCRLLASVLVQSEANGPAQVRYERAERALDRLAQVVDRLQHEVREVPR